MKKALPVIVMVMITVILHLVFYDFFVGQGLSRKAATLIPVLPLAGYLCGYFVGRLRYFQTKDKG
ncbi:hypothetical protein PAECIP111893_01363 [Paenibacillus plantiphilus]|uniref:Uncharacterized protein n=1 Tax=Paenibacillus plantiphilus TaxID=2905650 RepID=A0ABM9C0L2_9BACL|nr:hypothetical protein [Paenibacillus plantiphilus]CAH1200407.1 hypothetical protein PAECIP111893_01363 [Paenibacillus plantiphilus]